MTIPAPIEIAPLREAAHPAVAPYHLLLKLANNCVANVAGILSAVLLLFSMINLKAEPSEHSPVIAFPPSTAQKWILPSGLTVIVQEDHSAPVASVQAWCATGSIAEDQHLGAGLSHILEHMLFKGTKTQSANQIAQGIQDVGGYINAYTSFDRTVFWIDVPKDGVGTALKVLSDATMNSTLPPDEYKKEQEVIRRNNLTFVVVGDVDAEKVRQQLGDLFKPYPEKSLKPVFIPSEPPQLGRREVHGEFSTELAHLAMAWHIPEVTSPDVPALDLLSTILGDGRSSRLYRRVREEAGLAFGISAFSYTPGDPGLFGIDATLDPKKREAAEQLALQIIDEVKQTGVTADELEKAKKIMLSQHLGALTTMRGQASDTGSNWLLTRDLNFSREYLDAIQKVTLDDVKRVAKTYLTENNLTVVSLNPKGSLSGKAEPVKPVAAGEIQKFELSNGLRLLVREDHRLPLVGMGAVFRGGLLAENPEDNGVTRLMTKVLLKGTKTRTAEQIANELESVGGSISSDAGNNSFSVSVDVMKPDVKLGVGLLSDVLLNATFPEKAIAREKEIQIASIQQEEEQLTSVARNIMRQALFPQHPYALRSNGSVEAVQHLTQKDLVDFRDRYVVAKNGVIYVFGDVKAAEVKQLIEETLGKMQPGALALTDAKPSMPLSKSETVESRKDKAQGVLMVGFRGASLSSPDRYALELIDEASSDLGSRFFIRIREQMGLAYYVGASEMQGLVPGLFAFYLGTDPQKIEPVKVAFLDEIHKLANEGLTLVELQRAKKKLIGQQEIANQSNDAFGYHCALDELYGLGFDYYKRLEHDVNAVTLDDTKKVAAKYFRDQPYVLATVQPPNSANANARKPESSPAAKQK